LAAALLLAACGRGRGETALTLYCAAGVKPPIEDLVAWQTVEANVKKNGVFKPTVPELANDIVLGAADAAIVWDATANQIEQIESIRKATTQSA